MKNYKTILPLEILLFLLVFLFSCSKEQVQSAGSENFPSFSRSSCSLYFSYQITTKSFARAANINEQSQLSQSEQTMSYPTYTRCSVAVCIEESGSFLVDMKMLPFPEAPVYPENTLGKNYPLEESTAVSVEIRDASVSYFNADGALINSEFTMPPVYGYILEVIDNVKSNIEISPEMMDVVIQAFEEANFEVANYNDNIVVLTETLSDGLVSKVVLDKQLGVIRGQADLDVNGEIISKSNLTFNGDEITGHRFVTYVPAPFSGKRMAIVRNSVIKNFQLTTNN